MVYLNFKQSLAWIFMHLNPNFRGRFWLRGINGLLLGQRVAIHAQEAVAEKLPKNQHWRSHKFCYVSYVSVWIQSEYASETKSTFKTRGSKKSFTRSSVFKQHSSISNPSQSLGKFKQHNQLSFLELSNIFFQKSKISLLSLC